MLAGACPQYYALANNAIGWWLDRGKCQSVAVGVDLPEDVMACRGAWKVAVGETVILLAPPLHPY